MLFPLRDRHFRCALLAATTLGGPNARLSELTALYELIAHDGIEMAFLLGGATATNLNAGAEIDCLAEHYPRVPGVKTYYPCAHTAQGMAKAHRDDWHYLPPTISLLVTAGVTVPLTHSYEPDAESYDHACRQPAGNFMVDSLQLFAGASCRDGVADHQGSRWLIRGGAFSAAPGTSLPVIAVYLDLEISRDGRIRDDDYVLLTQRF